MVVCSYCGAAFFSSPDRDTGWLLSPRISLAEVAAAAKTWLRAGGHRVRRLDPPRGYLLPVHWARGRFLVWELADWPGPRSDLERKPDFPGGSEPGFLDLWESRFAVDAYANTFPAHPLSSLLPGRETRLESVTLVLLDPGSLPPGYRLVEPTVTGERGKGMRDAWLARRAGRTRGTAGRVVSGEQLHLVMFPMAIVPFLDLEGRERMVAVDGLSGDAVGEVPGSSRRMLHGIDAQGGATSRAWRPPLLVPLECGECGFALTPDDRDRLYGCAHCGSAWEMAEGERRAVRQWALPGKSTDRWLPFWVFGRSSDPETLPEDVVFTPAYAARHPEDQLHLAARLTREPPPGSWAPVCFEIHKGARVGSADARVWRWAVEGALSRASLRTFLTFMRAAPDLDRQEPLGLAWIPFHARGGDLVEPLSGAQTRAVGTLPWAMNGKAA